MAVALGTMALAPAPSTAAARPSITRVSPGDGSLTAKRVTVLGRGLTKVRAVTFGGVRARSVRVLSSGRLTAIVPRRSRPGRVAVRVQTSAGWSAATRAASYTYVARPGVSGLSPSTGPDNGGTTVTVRGRYLGTRPTVTFGGVRARVTKVSAGSLTVVTPPGLPGVAGVLVSTPGGRSAASTSARFTFEQPVSKELAAYDTSPGTVQGSTGVQWVTGGTDYDSPRAGQVEPWVVSLAAGTAAPEVGAGYFLPPGTPAHPTGLAGVVDAVAVQLDGSTRVSVLPSPVSEVMDEVKVNYVGAVGDPQPAARAEGDGGTVQTKSVEFAALQANALLCKDKNGSEASVRGSVGVRLENVHTNFDLITVGAQPHVYAWVTAQPVVFGKITANASVTCKIKPAWQNSLRKVFPLGATGATVSFAPTASVSISASGTWTFEQQRRIMMGFSTSSSGALEPIMIGGSTRTGSTGSANLTVKASAGLSVQIGALDRVGIQGTAQATAAGTVKVSTGSSANACVTLAASLDFALNAYLDLWVARWDSASLSKSVALGSWSGCAVRETPAPAESGPSITTTRLTQAVTGDAYDERLTTADDRNGTWAVAGGQLPSGLRLDAGSGAVTGRPTATVGDHAFSVRFTDGSGRQDTRQVRLYVAPAAGVGGGDVQATLTWSGPADLDLHVNDPNGVDIYYGEPGPTDEGGTLDHDANAACETVDAAPAENTFWPHGAAPAGQYDFWVQVYDECEAADLSWRLVVRVDGRAVIMRTGTGDSEKFVLNLGSANRAARSYALRPSAPAPKEAGPRK